MPISTPVRPYLSAIKRTHFSPSSWRIGRESRHARGPGSGRADRLGARRMLQAVGAALLGHKAPNSQQSACNQRRLHSLWENHPKTESRHSGGEIKQTVVWKLFLIGKQSAATTRNSQHSVRGSTRTARAQRGHGVRYFVDYTKNRPIYTSPHGSQEECVPRRVRKVSPYLEADESILGPWLWRPKWGK